MRTSILTYLALPLFAALGCKTSYASTRAQSGAAAPHRDAAAAQARCPLDVPGSSVSASDTSDGAALGFTAPPAERTSLRTQVEQWAEQIGRPGAESDMGTGSGAPIDGSLTSKGEAWAGSGNESGGMGDAQSFNQGPTGAAGAADGARADQFPPVRAVVEDTDLGVRLVLTPNDPADAQRLREATHRQAAELQANGCVSASPSEPAAP
jgi:hypothetical protein